MELQHPRCSAPADAHQHPARHQTRPGMGHPRDAPWRHLHLRRRLLLHPHRPRLEQVALPRLRAPAVERPEVPLSYARSASRSWYASESRRQQPSVALAAVSLNRSTRPQTPEWVPSDQRQIEGNLRFFQTGRMHVQDQLHSERLIETPQSEATWLTMGAARGQTPRPHRKVRPEVNSGLPVARPRSRDWDGKGIHVQATAETRPAAERQLKKKLAERSLFRPLPPRVHRDECR